ncbi:MAG: PLDc N-terminal domain-containing protein, partial [Pseudomonadales bacterium]|nr:PLDc N-terminal domain-containing protein [Pseudomonadales bacterium]
MGLVLYLLSLAVSVALIVHCFRTGRNTLWIMALMFLPLAGAIAYVIVEVLPDLRRSRTLRKATQGMRRTLDPQRDLREFKGVASVSGDVASRQRYADELVRLGRAPEAIEEYRQCLTGLFEHDPKLL